MIRPVICRHEHRISKTCTDRRRRDPTIRGGHLELLLIKRKADPFAGLWALPGGYVDQGESPEEAALRELAEETHLSTRPLFSIGVFGAPDRDPRGWVVSAAYLAFAPADCTAVAGDDAAEVDWHPLDTLPKLAFDHTEVILQRKHDYWRWHKRVPSPSTYFQRPSAPGQPATRIAKSSGSR